MQFIKEFFNHYGYVFLFISLTFELLALPAPGETLMTYCGFLVFEGRLNLIISIFFAALGVITGVTISYYIGSTLGHSFLIKYGHYIHMGPDRIEKISKWFERYGNKLLFFTYFIPGIRHITGYFSGAAEIPFKKFALNAYIGAFLWVSTFISLGRVLGSNWEKFHGSIKRYLIIGSIIIGIILAAVYLYRNYKKQIVEFVLSYLKKLVKIYHSLGKIKAAMTAASFVFIGLSIFAIGIIQDFLSNEFIQFNDIVSYLVELIFPENWDYTMKLFWSSASPIALLILTILVFILIEAKGKNRFLEIRFLIIVIFGGEVLGEVLRMIFTSLGPIGLYIKVNVNYSFPSVQALVAFASYGFASFIVMRHVKNHWIGTLAIITAFILASFLGLSSIYLKYQYPSDILGGYVFGGIWLSLNIILLEVFRILPKIKE